MGDTTTKEKKGDDVSKTREELEKSLSEEENLQEDEMLEKALDVALAKLNKSDDNDEDDEEDDMGEGEGEGEQPKKKKKRKGMSKSLDIDVDDDDDVDFDVLSKSLDESIADEDDFDGGVSEQFVKSLVGGIEKQLVAMCKSIFLLADGLERLEKSTANQQGLDIAQARMIKSMYQDVKKIGQEPQPLKSVIAKGVTILQKSTGDDGGEKKVELSKSEALERLSVLGKSRKLSLEEVTIAEARIQRGIPLSDKVNRLLSSSEN